MIFADECEALCRAPTDGSGPPVVRGMRMTSQVLVATTVCETKGEFLMKGSQHVGGVSLVLWCVVIPRSDDARAGGNVEPVQNGLNRSKVKRVGQ